ncbi:MAG TPA: hypothetical protein VIA64_01175 [Burkholderiales bacterium]|jgi:hypothetical protein
MHRHIEEMAGGFLDTPYGRLYRPIGQWRQIAVLVAVFFGGPALGWLVGRIPGDLSESARTALYVPYILVFFFGYAAWVARLNAIAFDTIGRSLLKTLFLLIIHRRAPGSAEEVLPSKEKLLEMAVRAQKAGASFGPASWPVALVAGLIAMLFESATGAFARFLLVTLTCLAWGHFLASLGRRGRLPFMEEG